MKIILVDNNGAHEEYTQFVLVASKAMGERNHQRQQVVCLSDLETKFQVLNGLLELAREIAKDNYEHTARVLHKALDTPEHNGKKD